MIEVLKQMVEALEWCHGGEPIGTAEAIKAGKQAIAELESQEPVAWISPSGALYRTRYHAVANAEQSLTPLYTYPPQRTWQGLMAADRKEIERQSVYVDGAIRMTEAKLKEKNNA